MTICEDIEMFLKGSATGLSLQNCTRLRYTLGQHVCMSTQSYITACCRAKNVVGDSQSSLKQAATQAAEIQAQHKSFIRRSQAAQSPLPQLPGKAPAQAAQPRNRTAAVPRKASA